MAQAQYSDLKYRKQRARFDWDQFDALPREVRDVLNYAAFSYTTSALYNSMCKGTPVARLVKEVAEADQKFLERVQARRAAEDERRKAEAFLRECGL
jgi:hypothetical protein